MAAFGSTLLLLTKQEIAEARRIRDAEKRDPGSQC
jgi:hypothetical protein